MLNNLTADNIKHVLKYLHCVLWHFFFCKVVEFSEKCVTCLSLNFLVFVVRRSFKCAHLPEAKEVWWPTVSKSCTTFQHSCRNNLVSETGVLVVKNVLEVTEEAMSVSCHHLLFLWQSHKPGQFSHYSEQQQHLTSFLCY